MVQRSSILLIGAGKMGGALLGAWLHSGVAAGSVSVVEPSASFTAEGVKVHQSLQEVSSVPGTVVLAVKPQSMDKLLPELAQKFGDKPLYVSIAAGKTIGYFEKHLGAAAIVRAMPNTPALIGKGISALCANAKTTKTQKQFAAFLLEAAGEMVWLEDESQMDAVTAISGSGPAYVFLFIEALIDAGVAQGLPENIAKKLAIDTVLGSAELAKASGESLAALRRNVTSPGGTTEAALDVLMKEKEFGALLHKAVTQAVKRAKELA